MFYIIGWKEFNNRKMEQKAEIVKEEDEQTALQKMKVFNAEQRKTSTDYYIHDLSKMLEDKGLQIEELIQNPS